MIAAWMLYVMAFTAIYGVAGWAVERGRSLRGQRRNGWTGVLIFTIVATGITFVEMRDDREYPPAPDRLILQFAAPTPAVAALPAVSFPSETPATSSRPAWRNWIRPRFGMPADSPMSKLDRPLLGLWGAASAIMLVLLVGSALRTARARRGGREVDIDGTQVVVTDRVGPAVVGMFPGRIVAPRWILDVPVEQQRLIIAHERSHIDAGDSRNLFLGMFTLFLFPWNAPLWWITRRQRLAIEADCDARVLEQFPDRRVYGDLLLDMSERAIAGPVPTVALAESRWMLEHRLRALGRQPRSGGVRAVAFDIGGLMLVLVACTTPRPSPIVADSGPQLQLAMSQVGRGNTPNKPCIAGRSRGSSAFAFVPIGWCLTSLPSTFADNPEKQWLSRYLTYRKDTADSQPVGRAVRWKPARSVPLTDDGLPITRNWTLASAVECGRSVKSAGGWAPWQAKSGSAATGDFPGGYAAMRDQMGIPLSRPARLREDSMITGRLLDEARAGFPGAFNPSGNIRIVGFLFDATGKLIDRMTCTRPVVVEREYLDPGPLVRALFSSYRPQHGYRDSIVIAGVRGLSLRGTPIAPGNYIDVIAVWGVVPR